MILSKEEFENIDKFFINDNTMDINTSIGSKVIFAFPDNGMEYEKKAASKYLKLINSVHFRNKGGK